MTETSRSNQENILQRSLARLEKLNAELTLRLGILQAQQGKTAEAIKTWEELIRQEGQGDKGDKGRESFTYDTPHPTPHTPHPNYPDCRTQRH
ncbi:MAG: hypothetical protein N4J56_005644 [Chroococcidiopsis sp. SAG 2025]|nr:hypothetical protein [Chroococcidiopsis sp. SAG 2025]MDV2995990.1 hypothetical protein [Chroococcidiopsis sp. SAG 2025]